MVILTVYQHCINGFTVSLHLVIPLLMAKINLMHTPAAPGTIDSKEETCRFHEYMVGFEGCQHGAWLGKGHYSQIQQNLTNKTLFFFKFKTLF